MADADDRQIWAVCEGTGADPRVRELYWAQTADEARSLCPGASPDDPAHPLGTEVDLTYGTLDVDVDGNPTEEWYWDSVTDDLARRTLT